MGVLFTLQVSVDYQKNFILTPSRQALGKALGHHKHHSFAKPAVQNVITHSYIVKHLGKIIKAELLNLCSNSILLNKALTTFSWDNITQECKLKSSLLYVMLESCLPKAMGLDSQVIIGTCICVLAKLRRSSVKFTSVSCVTHPIPKVMLENKSALCVTYHLNLCG